MQNIFDEEDNPKKIQIDFWKIFVIIWTLLIVFACYYGYTRLNLNGMFQVTVNNNYQFNITLPLNNSNFNYNNNSINVNSPLNQNLTIINNLNITNST